MSNKKITDLGVSAQCSRCCYWQRVDNKGPQFQEIDNGKAAFSGECRRRAPVPRDGFPIAFDTGWCGEFRTDSQT